MHDQRHLAAPVAEEDRGLARRVGSPHHDDGLPGAGARFDLGGGVLHAHALETAPARQWQGAVRRTGGYDHSPGMDQPPPIDLNRKGPGAATNGPGRARGGHVRPELLCLDEGLSGEVGARDSGREPHLVLDPRAGRCLPPDADTVEEQRVQSFGRGTDSGSQARRSRPDHDEIAHAPRRVRVVQAQVGGQRPGRGSGKDAVGVITTGTSALAAPTAAASAWPAASSTSIQVCGTCWRASQLRRLSEELDQRLPMTWMLRAPLAPEAGRGGP